MTMNTLNMLNNVYNERIRIVRETNERAVKNKKEFAEGGNEDKRESRTECGVLVRDECMRGVHKNVREKTKERPVVIIRVREKTKERTVTS